MVASLLGGNHQKVRHFQLGAFKLRTILDGALVRDLKPLFCVDPDEARIAALAEANFGPITKIEHTFTVPLVNTGRELVLFDTGHGAARRDVGVALFSELLPEAGYRPEDIDVVAFTHVHPNHIAGLRERDDIAYRNAPHVIGQRQEHRDLLRPLPTACHFLSQTRMSCRVLTRLHYSAIRCDIRHI